jgi:aspartyl/asparaginyl-tRNA synthetase
MDALNPASLPSQSGVGFFFREFLIQNGFTEIHSPKIISAASESGASYVGSRPAAHLVHFWP